MARANILRRKAESKARLARAAAGLAKESGLLRAVSFKSMLRFAAEAVRAGRGPHLATLFHAHNSPNKTALSSDDTSLSFRELQNASNRLARALLDLGVTPHDRVALMLPNCLEHLVAQLTLPQIGASAVEIGGQLEAKEVAYILDHSEPQVVLYHRDHLRVLSETLAERGFGEERLIVVGGEGPGHDYDELTASYRGAASPTRLQGSHQGGIIVYTSGTTGSPKGADRGLEDTSFGAPIDLMRTIGMRHDDRQLIVCPLYHSAATAFAAMSLGLGATVVLVDHFDAAEVLRTIERERITGVFLVPTMLERLLDLPDDIRARVDTSSLRWVCSGAAPLSTQTAAAFQDAYGEILWNFYGATEIGLVSLAGPGDHAVKKGSVGRALADNEIRILDEDGEPLAPGEVGEIAVRNGMLIRGYHSDPEATSEALHGGFFSVGDLGRLDPDGFLTIVGRKSDMVISGGVNIYPREIENHLFDHPDIADAAVVGVPSQEWGESLVAFVVARPATSLSEKDVIEHCRGHLAGYKCPRSVVFLDDLPRNPTGKVLKRALRETS